MVSSSRPGDLHVANDLRLAREDLKVADALLAIHNRFAAYHYQQCAEKVLLALLTAEGTQIERREVHRLDVLRDKLPDENPFKERLDPLTVLTLYATTYRYPKEGGRLPATPSRDTMDGWASQLQNIVTDAAKHFGVDLSASDRIPASNLAPPRSSKPIS